MNTGNIKRFAQDARKKLMEQVGARLAFVLSADSAILREQAGQVQQLRLALESATKEQLIEKVAYTWFNRLMALRFMDANGYQPLGIRVITPKDGYTTPELLDEAKRGNIPEDLHVNRQRVYDLLDNRIPSNNPQNEAYKVLLIAACNHLHSTFPFLFERINDYTELLMPDDLTSGFSIVTDIRNGMPAEDCQNVEIIGWLYQDYVSEENEKLISSKKVYDKNELAPASELFTPKWIVQYMVDNTLGQLITELFPTTQITQHLQFYIKPAYINQLPARRKKRLEEIRFFDPCVGSAHVLSYAFDVFYLIYKELGYNEFEIPELIIKHNLYGTDIDERAAQLASFVLMMKGRQYYRRFLNKEVIPNIAYYKDFDFDNKFNNAATLGSLIKVQPNEAQRLVNNEGSLFAEMQKELKMLYELLGQKYDIVVTNPPYISSSRMEGTLKQHVNDNYPDTKSDLFATFILRCLELCADDGLTGYMSPFVWMFISSYTVLREKIISNHLINNLIQLEYSGFDGATVPVCTFTLRKRYIQDAKGSYIRLTDFKGARVQAPKTLEAIQNPQCGWFYTANQNNFGKIPGSPIGYWASNMFIKIFESNNSLGKYANLAKGMDSGKNDLFIRLWFECQIKNQSFTLNDSKLTYKGIKWIPYRKGGEFRKWYGNNDYVINWEDNGAKVKQYSNSNIRNEKYYFNRGLSWTLLSSSYFGIRYYDNGGIFDANGSSLFIDSNEQLIQILGLLSSKVSNESLKIINPTLAFQKGNLELIPVNDKIFKDENALLTLDSIEISRTDWDSRETSWDFKQNELIRCKANCAQNYADLDMLDDEDRTEILALTDVPTNSRLMEDCYQAYKSEWRRKFFQLHQNEEELNRQFIEIYGLQDELTPDVPLEDITILKEETSIVNGELVFHADEVMAQFISYAVGCMFGRYSIDKQGLILAIQGETLQDYLQKIGTPTPLSDQFLPDEDNIIPMLDDEWFEDDIVGKFYQFLRVSFGEQNFAKNLAFIEEQLGKDVRKYFTKDFYTDHLQRYKKRPIYWMFSSPKGTFNVLIYMHRYTPDTLSNILNKYLREFTGKLKTRREHLQHVLVNGTAAQQTSAIKENDSIDRKLIELQEYERDVLFPLATERIVIDLDDGVLVNYNKFGKAVKEVAGLNDTATKKKVKEFDWIDTTQIR